MSVETTSSSANTHKASGQHEARAAKGRGAGAADASAQGPQGFLSILTALGDADTEAPLAGATDVVSDPNAGPLAVANVPLEAPFQNAVEQTPGMDASALLAQGAQLQGQVASAAPTALPVAGATGPTDSTRTPGGPRGIDGVAALRQAKQESDAPVAGQKKPGLALGKDKDKKNPLPEQASAVASVATQKVEPKDVRQFVAAEIQKALQPVQTLVQAVATEGARTEKRSDERSVFSTTPASDNSASAAASVGSADTGFSLAAPTEAAAPAEVQVAEQVQYWISNDVQKAEMKLDGLGENPVEVSIRMQGNEAHVAFRSDESATRGILQGAEGHLRDMLQKEGLLLGGVHVGGAGAQAQGNASGQAGSDRRPREGVRTARIAPAGLDPLHVPRQPATTSNRAVDLFV